MRRALAAAVVLGLLAAAACGPKQWGKPLSPYHQPLTTFHPAASDDAGVWGPLMLVGSLQNKVLGPELARAEKGALVAYVKGTGSGPRPVVAVALDAHGTMIGQPSVVAQAPQETGAMVVRRGGGDKPAYLVAWTSLTDLGESLSVLGVGDDGKALGLPGEIARTNDEIVWVELVPTAHGSVCLWVQETAGGETSVLALALDPAGRARGVPSRVARGVTAWQAVPASGGAGLAVVQPPASHAPPPAGGARISRRDGALRWLRVDEDGHVAGQPVAVASSAAADMDVARVASPAGDAFVFAWTDRSRADPEVQIAGVDAAGKVVPARDLLPERGGSQLVDLAGGKSAAAVVWDDARHRERQMRPVHVALVPDAKRGATAETSLELSGAGTPELRPAGDGFALLAMARACALGSKTETCPAAPLFVRMGPDLAVTQAEALAGGPAVSLAWSLDCAGGQACEALAAGPDLPTPVYRVDLGERASTHRAPLVPPPPPDAPRVTALGTFATGEVTDIAAIHAGSHDLVTAVTTADNPKGEGATLRAWSVEQGKTTELPPLSTRALPAGGVAMAPSHEEGGAVVAYVARDAGDPQVHLARLDSKGRKRSDVQITTAKGDAGDVAVARAAGGYIVAWVDGRDGNGEVYAAKVGWNLARPAHQERVTDAPGDATGTTVVATPSGALLAWADPRESPSDGFADIYVAPLDAKGKKAGRETRVLSTAAHSRSPSLAATGDRYAVAWIEDAGSGAASAEAKGAMLAMVDASGKVVRPPVKLPLGARGTATAVVLDASQRDALRAVVARSTPQELWLDTAKIGSAITTSRPLVALDGPPTLDVAMSLAGTDLFYADDGPDADDARARRAVIDWRK